MSSERRSEPSKSEWFTPKRFAEAAREVLGGIDLDPASCLEANETIKAARIFTVVDDGLKRQWEGRIFLNPPYSNAGVWIKKLLEEYESGRAAEAILLVNSCTDTQWFQPLWSFPLCFVRGRIAFNRPEGYAKKEQPRYASAFVLLSRDAEQARRFIEIFSEFGQTGFFRDRIEVCA